MKPSDRAALIALVVAGFAVWGCYAIKLDQLGGWIPWVAGLIVLGSLYASLVEIAAHENMADRDK